MVSRTPPARRRRRERGFALVLVLGALPVLAMLGSQVRLAARTELRLAANVREAATREAAADGAIRGAVFHLVAGDWQADGVVRRVRVGTLDVDVRVEDERGKVNPSIAPLALLRALLLTLGVPFGRADSLAAAIVDYRDGRPDPSPHGAKAEAYRAAGKAYGPSGLPFQRLDELRLVLGMGDDAYLLLLPYLSLYNGQGIDMASADPVVRAAFHLAGPYGGYFKPMEVVGTLVASVVATPVGGGMERRAVARVYDAGTPDQAFEMVEWSTRRP